MNEGVIYYYLLIKYQLSERIRMSEAPVVVKKKPFKKQIYRGVELDKLLEMNQDAVVKLMKSRA